MCAVPDDRMRHDLCQTMLMHPERARVEVEKATLGLMALNRELVGPEAFGTWTPPRVRSMANMPTGHESVCYHPLLLFNQHGDWRRSCVPMHSAEDCELLLPEIERQQAAGKQVASGAMRLSRFRNAACSTPSAFRPTGAWS